MIFSLTIDQKVDPALSLKPPFNMCDLYAAQQT